MTYRTKAQRRRSTTKKLVASAALIGGALALTMGGAFASFTYTATTGPQSVSSGTIVIGTGATNDSGIAATNIVAGDTVSREVDLVAKGTANAGSITLQFTTSTPTSLLNSDPTNGLQLSIKACAAAPVRVAGPPPSYTCGGGWTAVTIGGAATASVASLVTAPAALAPLNSLTVGGKDYLVFTLTLPATAPGDLSKVATACSGTIGGTSATENLEGCTSALTYNFLATQRAAAAE
jgi:hypothetical protein